MKQTIAVRNVKRCDVSNRPPRNLISQGKNRTRSAFGHRAMASLGFTKSLFLLTVLVGVAAVKKDESSSKNDAQI